MRSTCGSSWARLTRCGLAAPRPNARPPFIDPPYEQPIRLRARHGRTREGFAAFPPVFVGLVIRSGRSAAPYSWRPPSAHLPAPLLVLASCGVPRDSQVGPQRLGPANREPALPHLERLQVWLPTSSQPAVGSGAGASARSCHNHPDGHFAGSYGVARHPSVTPLAVHSRHVCPRPVRGSANPRLTTCARWVSRSACARSSRRASWPERPPCSQDHGGGCGARADAPPAYAAAVNTLAARPYADSATTPTSPAW